MSVVNCDFGPSRFSVSKTPDTVWRRCGTAESKRQQSHPAGESQRPNKGVRRLHLIISYPHQLQSLIKSAHKIDVRLRCYWFGLKTIKASDKDVNKFMPQEIIRLPIKGEFVDIAIISHDDSKPADDIDIKLCDDISIDEDRVALRDTVFGEHQTLSLSISVFADDKYVGDITKVRGAPFWGGPQFQDITKYLFCGKNLRFFLKAGYIRLSRERNGLGYDAIFAYCPKLSLDFRLKFERNHLGGITPIFAITRLSPLMVEEEIAIKAVSKDFVYIEYYSYELDVGNVSRWYLVRHETSSSLSQPFSIRPFLDCLQIGEEIRYPLSNALQKFGVAVTADQIIDSVISRDDDGVVFGSETIIPSYRQLNDFFLKCNAGRGDWMEERMD